MTSLEQLMVTYLKDRDLERDYVERAGARLVDAVMARGMGFPHARRSQGGIVYPFLHPITRMWQGSSLMRIRYLGKLPVGSDGKEVRYTQPRGSGVEAFFDANVDWLEVMRNPSIEIAITEGEAKALYMNQHRRALGGIVTIALGGVWNFRDKETGDLTPWLRMVRAASSGRGRRFIIAFDSDMAENESIQAAARKLSELLRIEVRGVMTV